MVSGLKRLSDREARQVLVRCHLLFDVHYCRQRRPLPQPGTERIERIARPARQDFNIAGIQVNRVARDTKLLSLAPGAVTKPNPLDTTPNPDSSGLC